jgi:hypothetical protein
MGQISSNNFYISTASERRIARADTQALCFEEPWKRLVWHMYFEEISDGALQQATTTFFVILPSISVINHFSVWWLSYGFKGFEIDNPFPVRVYIFPSLLGLTLLLFQRPSQTVTARKWLSHVANGSSPPISKFKNAWSCTSFFTSLWRLIN